MDYYKLFKTTIFVFFINLFLFLILSVPVYCAEVQVPRAYLGNFVVNSQNVIVDALNVKYCSYYFALSPGVEYTIKNNNGNNVVLRGYFLNEEPSLGMTVPSAVLITDTYVFSSDESYFFYVFFNDSNLSGDDVNNLISITYDNGSMSGTVASLVYNVGFGDLWNVFDISVGYIVVVVLFVFGWYIIHKLIKRLSKGKSGNV